MSDPIHLERAIAKAAAARAMPFRMVKAFVKLGKLTPAEGRAVIETMLQPRIPENDMIARGGCVSSEPVVVQEHGGTTALVETTWKQAASPDGSVMVR